MPRTHAGRLVTQLIAAACLMTVGILREAQAAPQKAISVVGNVTAEGEQGVPRGVTVSVETFDGKRLGEVAVNGQGEFRVTLVPTKASYRLTIKAAGYYPIQQELDVRSAILAVPIRAVLTPIPGAKRAGEALLTLTDQIAPRKARKAYEKGVQAVQAHNLPDAQRDFSEAVAVYPCYARAQTGLAALLIGGRDLPAAEAALHKAIQCDPNFYEGFVWLGRVLNSERRFTESVAILQQGLRLSPSAWGLYDQLAAAHYSLGLYPQAREEWLRVEEINPEAPPELHAKLSTAYLREGNSEKAYAEMQAYLQAEPEGRFAPQLKSLMHQLEAAGAVHNPSEQAAPPVPPKP
ncbi:MAG: tetratricopeptide repeat protein [Acidobacteriia bacterium]|nr:tetratricopeptide repeat protein [Terriglobia bacterium]